MARKSLCFLKVLYRNNLIRQDFYQKIIVADTSVEFPCEYLKNKKITIIDDIMISGTSISKMIHFLLGIGIKASDINVYVIAVDIKYNYIDFYDHNTKHRFFDRNEAYVFDDAMCIELSANIAHLIARVGDSYNTDFPEYHKFILDNAEFENLFTKEYWEIYDVTNSYHKKGNVESYTFIPKKNALDAIAKLLGFDIRENAFLKVRLIAKTLENDQYECLIVPLIIVNKLSYEEMLLIWNIMLNYSDDENAEELSWGIPALFRMIQFFISKVIADYFIEQKGLAQVIKFDRTCLTTSFGYDCNERIESLLKRIGHNSEIKKEINSDNDSIAESENTTGSEIGAFALNEQLLKPIADWYQEKEIPTRNAIVTYAKENGEINCIDDFNVIIKIDRDHRLNAGFSVTELRKAISNMKEYYRVGHVISIFLDRAIDNGYIVPINYIDGNKTACRAYRHGEDFPFSKEDESKLLFFIKSLVSDLDDRKLSDEIFSKVSFEKILVLFMQLAKNELFGDFMSFDNHDLLTVKYCIHGAVLVTVNKDISNDGAVDTLHPYAENNQYTPWLREKFEKKGIIKTDTVESTKGSWEGYRIDVDNLDDELESSVVSTDTVVQTKIKRYVSVIGKWYYSMRVNRSKYLGSSDEFTLFKDKGFRKDITILTSCASLDKFAGSILAELHYCILDLQKTVFSKLVDVSNDGKITTLNEGFDLYFGQEMNSLDKNRQYDTMAWFAMYNGIEKTDAYINNGVDQVIGRIKEIISDDDKHGLYEYTWDTIWNSSKSDIKEDAALKKWVYMAVTYIYMVYISYAELHNQCKNRTPNAIEYEQFRTHFINEVKPKALDANVSKGLVDQVDSLYKSNNYAKKSPEEKKKAVCRKLLTYKKEMIQVSQCIEMNLAEKSSGYIESYSNYIFVTFNKKDKETVKAALNECKRDDVKLISWHDDITYCLASLNKNLLLESLKSISQIPQLLNIIVFLDMTDELKLRNNARTDAKNLQSQYDQSIFTCLNINKNEPQTIVYSTKRIKIEDLIKWFGDNNWSEEKKEQINNRTVCKMSLVNGRSDDNKKGATNIMFKTQVNGPYIENSDNVKVVTAGDNSNNQIDTSNSNQTQTFGTGNDFDFNGVVKTIEEIKSFEAYFDVQFGQNADKLRNAITEAEDGAKEKNSSKVQAALKVIHDIAVGITGSLIANGIVKLILPFIK